MNMISDDIELMPEIYEYLSQRNIKSKHQYFYHLSFDISDFNSECKNLSDDIENGNDYFDDEFSKENFLKSTIKPKSYHKSCNYYRIKDEWQMDLYHDNVDYHIGKITNWELFEHGMKSSVYSVVLLDYWFDEKRYDRIDELIENLHIQVLTEWSIVALLRTTYSAKHLLSSWEDFYLKAQQRLNHITPKHAKKLLMGLDR